MSLRLKQYYVNMVASSVKMFQPFKFGCYIELSEQVEWSVKGGSLRNIESARVSIPGTLKYDDSKKW